MLTPDQARGVQGKVLCRSTAQQLDFTAKQAEADHHVTCADVSPYKKAKLNVLVDMANTLGRIEKNTVTISRDVNDIINSTQKQQASIIHCVFLSRLPSSCSWRFCILLDYKCCLQGSNSGLNYFAHSIPATAIPTNAHALVLNETPSAPTLAACTDPELLHKS